MVSVNANSTFAHSLFIALLYEWETEASNHAISIDRHEIFIRNNLRLALCMIIKIRDSGRSELQDVCMFSHIPLLSNHAKACLAGSHRGHVHRLPVDLGRRDLYRPKNTGRRIVLVY